MKEIDFARGAIHLLDADGIFVVLIFETLQVGAGFLLRADDRALKVSGGQMLVAATIFGFCGRLGYSCERINRDSKWLLRLIAAALKR
jgi:uncharacterized membrane protein YedE/YeeE